MPSSSFYKFDSFVEACAEKKHDLGSDTLKLALCNASNAPVAGDAVLTDLTLVSGANLVSDTPTRTSSGQTSGVYQLVLADFDLEAGAGGVSDFRYVVLYNADAANDELIGWWDYGSEIPLADGEKLTVDFSSYVIQLQ